MYVYFKAAIRSGNHLPSAPASNGATNGQPDYSAQWVDYYRRLGQYEEANAIEAQMKKVQNAYVTPGASPHLRVITFQVPRAHLDDR